MQYDHRVQQPRRSFGKERKSAENSIAPLGALLAKGKARTMAYKGHQVSQTVDRS